ncbi:MAG: lysophospholipid acyltransferase family protein [Candidatus Paceibacterota bacterium]
MLLRKEVIEVSSLKLIDLPLLVFYKLTDWFLQGICFLFFRIKITGREKVLNWKKKNKKTAFVAVARHRSLWDAVLMPVAFGGFQDTILNFVVKEEMRFLLSLMPFSDSYLTFIRRGKTKKATIEKLINLLVEGNNIAIFPEGSTVPEYKEMNRGVLLIIKAAEQKLRKQIPIFPLNIKVVEGFYGEPKGKWRDYILGKVRIELRIGGPIYLEDLEKLIIKQNLPAKNKAEEMVKLLLEQVDKI